MKLLSPNNPDRDRDIPVHAKRAILYFEVLYFYFVLFSMILFLLITRVLPFKTIRERQGYSLNLKSKQDFLYYVKDDIPWFNMVSA